MSQQVWIYKKKTRKETKLKKEKRPKDQKTKRPEENNEWARKKTSAKYWWEPQYIGQKNHREKKTRPKKDFVQKEKK